MVVYRGRNLLVFSLLLSSASYASFIESTIGTAVVNDATASYYNPAALVQLKNSQIIPQFTFASLRTKFSGQSTTLLTGVTESGTSNSNTQYYSPSLYMGMPVTNKITIGLAIVTNEANRNPESTSVLRYVQGKNNIQDYDVVPSFGIRINDIFSIGAGVNFSYAKFHLEPVTGIPGTNIADSTTDNTCDGSGVGANAGFLVAPTRATVIGFNYRSATTYNLSGKSVFEGPPQVVSNGYHYKMWTPAHSVVSINHFLTPTFGLIGTLQRIQWSRLTNNHIYGIATLVGGAPVIVDGVVPLYLRDTWVLTLGTHHRLSPHTIIRVAGTFSQSPGNPHYQVVTGDSFILGASIGYAVTKAISIDASYAHGFMQNQNINIASARNLINGVNSSSRDSVSLKLTFNT